MMMTIHEDNYSNTRSPNQYCWAMRIVAVSLAAIFSVSAVQAQFGDAELTLTAAEEAAGWEMLFNGIGTDHWRSYGKETFPAQGWTVENDGTLQVHAGGGGGDIVTRKQYIDFELSLEFKVAEKSNSGIMYRVTEEGGAPWMTGPEFQILDDQGYGFKPTESTAVGGCYALYDSAPGKQTKPVGEFNRARIIIKDNHVVHFLNGIRLLEYDLDSEEYRERIAASKFAAYEGFGVQSKGHIALQDHGNDVWFRNVKIRDLSVAPAHAIDLLASRSLRGWRWVSHARIAGIGTWQFEDGDDVMHCKGSPKGYIRTEKMYENYVLQLDWRWPNEPGNSGILLGIAGEDAIWPACLEAQLQHESAGDFWNIGEFSLDAAPDRINGKHIQKSRMSEYAVGEWNSYEIIVDHGTVRLFVNGSLVNEATNVDIPKGYIGLQSEGAPIEFRNMRLISID